MRRWSLAFLATLGLIVADAATTVFGAGLFGDVRGPSFRFEAAPPPPPPDYGKAQSWAARPDHPGETIRHPPGTNVVDASMAQADVFFIYPTSFLSGAAWNAAIDDEATNRRTDERSIRNQASVFNGCCRIYAPRYRQATLGAFFTQRKDDARKALNLAYQDVLAAFDYYMAHDNGGRPFIIASHSQGSRHAVQLLAARVAQGPARSRFVAAYILGDGIPEDFFTRVYKTIQPCKSATDTGCVISWSSYKDGADPSWTRNTVTHLYGTVEESNRGKTILCTNPLTWSMGTEKAPESLNLGAWAERPGEESEKPPHPGYAGARCENGALFTERNPDDEGGLRLANLRNEHVLDYQLFYMNIRANAVDRVTAFLRR